MAPSASSAWGSLSGGRAAPTPTWVLLARPLHGADLDAADLELAGTGGVADIYLQLVAPPGLSTAFVDGSLLPDDDDDDAARYRIHGADASGRLLFSPPPPRGAGDSHLAVCRPLTSGSTAKGKGTAIPAFPEEDLAHALSAFPGEDLAYALSEDAPTAILCDREAKGGDGFFVAQMKNTPHVAAVLIYSSDANGWSVAELPAVEPWNGFHATSVVAHEGGRSAGFVFVDMPRRGLLLLHPRRIDEARFLELPVPRGGEASVGSSDGRIVFVVFEEVEEGTLVRFWSLSQDERRWISTNTHLSSDRLFSRDCQVWPLRLGLPRVLGPLDPNVPTRVIVLGPLDPNMPTRVIVGDGTSAYFLHATPDEIALSRASPLAADSLVFHVPPPPRSSWGEAIGSAVEQGKHAGLVALGAVKKIRPYADTLPAVVQLVGATWSLPHTAVALTTARAIQTINNYFTISEQAAVLLWRNRPGASEALSIGVGSLEEAQKLLEDWKHWDEPQNVMVDRAPGLPKADWDTIRLFFKDNGGYNLVQHHAEEWEMVPN